MRLEQYSIDTIDPNKGCYVHNFWDKSIRYFFKLFYSIDVVCQNVNRIVNRRAIPCHKA